jgi:uncharacterized membrane protein YqiK
MADDTTSEASTTATTTAEAPAETAAKTGRKKATRKKATPKATQSKSLSASETAVLQHVTIAAAPRTAEELANTYGGIREANLWPELRPDQVEGLIKTLVGKRVLKRGEKAPDGESTIEVA